MVCQKALVQADAMLWHLDISLGKVQRKVGSRGHRARQSHPGKPGAEAVVQAICRATKNAMMKTMPTSQPTTRSTDERTHTPASA